jgi:tRNA (guanine10-N2)-dimethyltransferase
MYIAILGRQPAIGLAELECVFGSDSVSILSNNVARIDTESFDIERLGGSPKAGKIVFELEKSDWQKTSQKIIRYYFEKWSDSESKITLGISAYGFNVSEREVQKVGILLKNKLKKTGVSLRLVPNDGPALSSAVSHHNKLGLSPNKLELLAIKSIDKVIIAESVGSQNITAYAKRDQARPMRDAFVGMLPPKLAQIMINLTTNEWGVEGRISHKNKTPNSNGQIPTATILDPFCGTGVILQEAALMGYSVYGTDLSEKMIRYSRDNLNWLAESRRTTFDWFLHEGDAIKTKWRQPIGAVISEVYLGQPFSAPPSPTKLHEVLSNCNHILTEFLKNLAHQINPETPICLAVPAWRDKNGRITHLPVISKIENLGYKYRKFKNIEHGKLIYYRESQVVARELLVITKL